MGPMDRLGAAVSCNPHSHSPGIVFYPPSLRSTPFFDTSFSYDSPISQSGAAPTHAPRPLMKPIAWTHGVQTETYISANQHNGLDKLRGKKSKPKRKREDDDELNSDDNDTKEEDPLDLTQVKIADMLDKHLAGLLEFEPPPELPKKEGSVSTAAATSLLHPPLGLAEKKAKKLAREKLKKERKRAVKLQGDSAAAQGGSAQEGTAQGGSAGDEGGEDKGGEEEVEDEGEGSMGGASLLHLPLSPAEKKAKKLAREKLKKERKRALQLLGGREAAQGSIDANTGDGDKDDERTDEDEGEGNAGGESSCGDDGGVREGKGGVANQPNTPLTPEQKKAKKLLGEKKKKERNACLSSRRAT
eukprot:gene22698-29853_t